MAHFTARGKVVQAIGGDLGIRVDNEPAMRAFWQAERIDTKLNWFDNEAPVMSINKQAHIAASKIGDDVEITVEPENRANGKRGIKTLGYTNHTTGVHLP
jgi:hypothetical protein